MNASDKNSNREVVRGAGNFPAYAVLAGFVVLVVGMIVSNAWLAAAGAAVLLGSVISVESLVSRRGAEERRRWHNPNSVMRHV